jgi:uncharacterized protein YceH (UPF0502 family)
MTQAVLSTSEARVLGVLVEKQRTVPDTYPLTLNALVSGCNQKSSRDPVLALSDDEVRTAIDGLRHRSLVIETSGGRAMRYAHNAERVLGVPSQSVALLAALLLRGPQTAGELRTNTERMHRFADISTVEAFLQELAEREAGQLVAQLPRAAGTRETRWTELLSERSADVAAGTEPAGVQANTPRQLVHTTDGHPSLAGEVEALRAEVDALRDALAALRAEFEALRSDVAG